MDENSQNSKRNTRILLTRNTPVALVVGAASFFGSHLVRKLLLKNLQIIGVDDLAFGNKENLSKTAGDKNFHLVIQRIGELELEIDRLDYILIIPQRGQDYSRILHLFRRFRSRLLLISSVELYKREAEGYLKWLREVEADIAKAAKGDNLNARILRIGAVFGPKMNFNQNLGEEDPLIKLIHQALTGNLQKETALEFSSRALYIDDACTLAIKCIFAGATAQKIFDGVLPVPVKVSEIKQVLLDPVWYESRNFSPSELPPWPTPNLEKTIKFLNWHPQSKLVESLRLTLNNFKESETKIPDLEDDPLRETRNLKLGSGEKTEEWKSLKKGELQAFKAEKQSSRKEEKAASKEKTKGKFSKISPAINKLPVLAVIVLIFYALVWPVIQAGLGVLTFKSQLSRSLVYLEKGEFDKGLSSVVLARGGVERIKSTFDLLRPVVKLGVLRPQFAVLDNLVNLATGSLDSTQSTILGIQSLFLGLKSVTGELSDPPQDFFTQAQSYLSASDEDLSKVFALIGSEDFELNLPAALKPAISNWSDKLNLYSGLVKKGRAVSYLLPEVVGLAGNKDYLILLQNNNELRPTGGFIGSFAKVSFAGGKLRKLEVNDTYAVDGQLSIHVEPPKEIKEDLGQKDYFLRDANFEPDFPTSARQVEWFYTKETGERVEGVVALDISAIEDLLQVIGTLDLPDYNEKITAGNLFGKAISYSEVNFFPGTQAKKSFLTGLATALFNKLFFLPNQNWPGIVGSLGRSLEHKHLSIYLDDPKLFSYVSAQNWAGVLPRPGRIDRVNNGSETDFLATVEANLGADKANYYLDRKFNLETIIGRDGEINHRLRVSYINRSPSNAFPAGKYKNRMRIYLPANTKLTRALWAESDITKNVSSFSEYGRQGYSLLIELLPKEQKTLVLDYQPPLKLAFVDKKAIYRLDVIKQAGTLKDPFIWNVTYPINLRLVTKEPQKIGPQQHSIKTDLSTDKTFKLEFSK